MDTSPKRLALAGVVALVVALVGGTLAGSAVGEGPGGAAEVVWFVQMLLLLAGVLLLVSAGVAKFARRGRV